MIRFFYIVLLFFFFINHNLVTVEAAVVSKAQYSNNKKIISKNNSKNLKVKRVVKTPTKKRLVSKKINRFQPKKAVLVIDAKNRRILHSQNHTTLIHPASLTKVMTLYLLFEALEKQKVCLTTMLPVSNKAANMPPSKLWLKTNEKISVHDAILALIVKSANDVAVVVAEFLGKTEQDFVKTMNRTAKLLGMNNTTFQNASGWHHPKQFTTALDLATLSLSMKNRFHKYYPLFSKTDFSFKGKLIQGHNRVTKNYYGADGVKTGYTSPSGFNLITSATRDDTHLIGVIIGEKDARTRDNKMATLLDQYFYKQNSSVFAKTIDINSTDKLNSVKLIANDNKLLIVKPSHRRLISNSRSY